MVEIKKARKPKGYWDNYENCYEEVLKHNTFYELKNSSESCYNSIIRNNWIELIDNLRSKKPNGYWTKEKCQKEALKYTYKKDFKKYSSGAYNNSISEDWYEDICQHMLPVGTLYQRMIYAYEFIDNSVYIGLTCDINRRNFDHLNSMDSSVYKKYLKSNNLPKLVHISEYINVEEARKLEKLTVEEYKKKGWYILNRTKTGALGGNNLKWDIESIKFEAKKYNSRSSFSYNSESAYKSAIKFGVLDEVCQHMTSGKKENGYWNFENVFNEALLYNCKSDFMIKSAGAYSAARLNNWMEKICLHMIIKQVPKGWWNNKENCELESKKYNTRTYFQLKSPTAYKYACKNGWMDDFFPKI